MPSRDIPSRDTSVHSHWLNVPNEKHDNKHFARQNTRGGQNGKNMYEIYEFDPSKRCFCVICLDVQAMMCFLAIMDLFHE